MKTYPLVKERTHPVSQKIIRSPPNPKHIHLIRKIISNVVHGLDVDSRWTCRWVFLMYFPDDKVYPQIQNSRLHYKATYAQGNCTWKMVGKMIKQTDFSQREEENTAWQQLSGKVNIHDKGNRNIITVINVIFKASHFPCSSEKVHKFKNKLILQ